MRGRFITIEGGEAVGKSTQARHLADALRRAGVDVLLTREPGGTPGAEALRELLLDRAIAWSPLTEVLLHFAARAEHVATTIQPALEGGAWVVCDRYADSTMAYQGYGMGADRVAIATLAKLIGLDPDLTIMLEVSEATARRRLAGRGRIADRYERMGPEFMARVRDGFRAIAAAAPERCVLIAAEAHESDVAAAVGAVVRDRLGGAAAAIRRRV